MNLQEIEDKASEIQDLVSANPESLRDSVSELADLVKALAGALRNAPNGDRKPREWWVNLYTDGHHFAYNNKELADRCCSRTAVSDYIETIRVREVIEGKD